MTPIEPVERGTVVRDGVTVAYDVYGKGDITVLLLPTWSIIRSRFWKLQVPYLARHHRVITFDGRGTGRSDAPTDPDAYTDEQFADDAVAVLDATGTDAAVAVGMSCGSVWGLRLAADHPGRVLGFVAIAPAVPLAPELPARSVQRVHDVIDDPVGWEKYNLEYWTRNYADFVDWFMEQLSSEPHSTKVTEDAIAWAMETDPESLVAATLGLRCYNEQLATELCGRVTCPSLIIHGTDDRIQPFGRGEVMAVLLGGELVAVEGGGHDVIFRQPVLVNRAITSFIEANVSAPENRTAPGDDAAPRRRTWTRAMSRPRRALYLSSPIGLGHARRDVAIADQLTQLEPDLQIDWLAQDPVTRVLGSEGLDVHPGSRWLANESAHIAAEADGHDLRCFDALRRMDEILVANFMVFQEAVEDGHYDLVICDEAWDVDHFWHENPELKRADLVWMTDFVGFLPMPDLGSREAGLTADYNAEMIEHVDRFPTLRDRAIFVGDPDDVVPDTFGPDLPAIRDWTEQHFDFSGYVTGFEPPDAERVAELRERLGYRPDERVCIAAVGGSGVGRDLLDLVIAAFPAAQERIPELRMVVVAGPRIDPTSFARHDGLEIVGYVDRLHEHLAVCDLGIVQGGLTSTMELTAARRPFLYFPLRNHFEQQFHACHRLDRHRAGRRMDFHTTDPEQLADAIVDELARPVDYVAVTSDGAARAAAMIAELL